MKVADNRHVAFEEWFCHKTLENLTVNPQITIGLVNTQAGKGYQLIGEVEEVNVGAILELKTGPHSDEEIE